MLMVRRLIGRDSDIGAEIQMKREDAIDAHQGGHVRILDEALLAHLAQDDPELAPAAVAEAVDASQRGRGNLRTPRAARSAPSGTTAPVA